MPENLLQLLKLCFLALLYLFFLRVVWSVWQQVRTPSASQAARPAAPPPPAPPPPTKRKSAKNVGPPSVLDVVQPSSRAGISYPVHDELSIGRAAGCAVSLPDGATGVRRPAPAPRVPPPCGTALASPFSADR